MRRNTFLALLPALLTVLGILSATVQAVCSKDEALGEIDIYSDDKVLDYLSINNMARSQESNLNCTSVYKERASAHSSEAMP